MMNNLDQKLHSKPLVEKGHTFLATYSNSTSFLQKPDTMMIGNNAAKTEQQAG